MLRMIAVTVPLVALMGGCTFDEGLEIYDLHGTVYLPKAAATRDLVDAEGVTTALTDVRFLGPVYIGLYALVVDGIEDYPHPERGPQFVPDVPGDTYPYGGTSMGDFRYACLEDLQCKMVSGRYVDFDGIVSWFNDTLGEVITDASGAIVTNGDYMRQTCYELLYVTSDEEIRITAEDANEDGLIDLQDLQFVEDGDYFVGDFTLFQQDFYPGMSLWAFMDAPSVIGNDYTTCNPSSGYFESTYNRDFFAGSPHKDILNVPSQYIAGGDWVSGSGNTWDDPQVDAEIYIDFPLER